ncbi:hypothetical protein BJY04DRAFT_221261 [Aspergillus karnatakaensis]|uniref:uncharacterized protein n=1 Tax=Aspergillus karnatakaensis TaxID=1810916 RepID=UPI003CCC9827
MHVLLTNGLGHINSNLIKALNARGITRITVVDDLTNPSKAANIAGCKIADYLDIDKFREAIIEKGPLEPQPDIIFHNWMCKEANADGKTVMDWNYTFSKEVLDYCCQHGVRLNYGFSVVEDGDEVKGFSMDMEVEVKEEEYGQAQAEAEMQFPERNAYNPLTVHDLSKLLFNQYAKRCIKDHAIWQIVGLRYFEVYGLGEEYNECRASMVYALREKIHRRSPILVGENRQHDCIHVGDVIRVNMWFLDRPDVVGLFEVGTGIKKTTLEVRCAVERTLGIQGRTIAVGNCVTTKSGRAADLARLREVGYDGLMISLADGVKKYVEWMRQSGVRSWS